MDERELKPPENLSFSSAQYEDEILNASRKEAEEWLSKRSIPPGGELEIFVDGDSKIISIDLDDFGTEILK